MTKVQLDCDLVRPLTDEDAEGIASVHSFYGIVRVTVAPALDKVTVEFDASRLSEKEVEVALMRHGIPIKRCSAPV